MLIERVTAFKLMNSVVSYVKSCLGTDKHSYLEEVISYCVLIHICQEEVLCLSA